MYRILHAHKFSTVVAQATMNRPFPICGHACPDDHFRFLVPPRSQDMSQKTRYVACGLMRVVIACKNRRELRLRLRFAPRETYRSRRDKMAKTDALLPEIKIGISEFHFQNCRYAQSAVYANARRFIRANKRMSDYFLVSTEWTFSLKLHQCLHTLQKWRLCVQSQT